MVNLNYGKVFTVSELRLNSTVAVSLRQAKLKTEVQKNSFRLMIPIHKISLENKLLWSVLNSKLMCKHTEFLSI